MEHRRAVIGAAAMRPVSAARSWRAPAAVDDTGSMEQLSADERAIAKSVLFASVFDYPLTLAELRRTLIEWSQTPTQILTTYARSDRLRKVINERDGLFFPCNRPHLVDLRRAREHYSRAFLHHHRRYLRVACALPFVRLVALSGSVAHLNLDGDGDLDLFVVTSRNRAWCITVALIVLARLMRCRRVVCVNYVMADTRLEVAEADLFTASQLLHLRPLCGHDVYRALLEANPFVYRFYPNASLPLVPPATWRDGVGGAAKRIAEVLCTPFAIVAERGCRFAYARYLRARSASWASPEQVRLDADRLKLHTHSHRRAVLEQFNRVANDDLRNAIRFDNDAT